MAELLADAPEMERVKAEVARAFSETFDFFS
jgi:hypothetical protein